jgi:hypothetical protein
MALIAQTMARRNLYNRPIVGTLYTGCTDCAGAAGAYETKRKPLEKKRSGHMPSWGLLTGETGLNYPKNGYIAGTINVNGVAQIDVIVRLYRTIYPNCLRETKTDALGQYRFDDLNPSLSDYYTTYLAPSLGVVYNNMGDSGLTPSV